MASKKQKPIVLSELSKEELMKYEIADAIDDVAEQLKAGIEE